MESEIESKILQFKTHQERKNIGRCIYNATKVCTKDYLCMNRSDYIKFYELAEEIIMQKENSGTDSIKITLP